MFESALLDFIAFFGFPAIFLIFVLKGMLIGKFIPAIIVLSTYALISGINTPSSIMFLCLGTALGTLTGEMIIFRNVKKEEDSKLVRFIDNRTPFHISEEPLDNSLQDKLAMRIPSLFTSHVLILVFMGNLTSWFRSLGSIPAAKKNTKWYKYCIVSYISTYTYHCVGTYVFILGVSILF